MSSWLVLIERMFSSSDRGCGALQEGSSNLEEGISRRRKIQLGFRTALAQGKPQMAYFLQKLIKWELHRTVVSFNVAINHLSRPLRLWIEDAALAHVLSSLPSFFLSSSLLDWEISFKVFSPFFSNNSGKTFNTIIF